jgi:hypothetical protein
MKKYFFTLIFLLGCTGLITNAQTLATFENSSADFFNSAIGFPNCTMEVVENPAKAGINKTEQCLINSRNTAWTDAGRLCNGDGTPVSIDANNRYLHIMVYSAESADGLIRIQTGTSTSQWDNDKESRFSFQSGEWKDLVIDLQALNITSLYGLFFMSQDWGGAVVRNFYYDEFIINNEEAPRGIQAITGEMFVTGFEEDDIYTPAYQIFGADNTVVEVLDNHLKAPLNTSNKILKIDQTNETTWWSRLKIPMQAPLMITDANKYVHFLVYSPASPCAFVCA